MYKINEGKNQDESLAILKKFSKSFIKDTDGKVLLDENGNKRFKEIYSPEDIYSKLQQIDGSVNNKNLPFISYFWATTLVDKKRINLDILKEIFENYTDLVNRNIIKPLSYTKEGLKIENNIYDWTKFVELIDSKKEGEVAAKIDVKDLELDNDLIYKDDRYEVYLGDSMYKCIKLTDLVPVLFGGSKPTFCIGISERSRNLYWSMYRQPYESTFYFIYDRSKPEDKECIIVFDVRKQGFALTARNNNTGYTTHTDYLKRNPVIKELFDNGKLKHKELTIEETDFFNKFSNPLTDKEFIELDEKNKFNYIEFGHQISNELFKSLNPSLKHLYINMDISLTPTQLKSLSESDKKFYDTKQDSSVESKIKNKALLSDYQFSILNTTNKKLYDTYYNSYSKKQENKIKDNLIKIPVDMNGKLCYLIFKDNMKILEDTITEIINIIIKDRNLNYLPEQIKLKSIDGHYYIIDNTGKILLEEYIYNLDENNWIHKNNCLIVKNKEGKYSVIDYITKKIKLGFNYEQLSLDKFDDKNNVNIYYVKESTRFYRIDENGNKIKEYRLEL